MGELVQSWKSAIMDYFKVLPWHSSEGGKKYVRHLTQLFIITQFFYITLIKNVCHFSNVIWQLIQTKL